VLHPGASGKQAFELAIEKVADGLDQVFNTHPDSKALVLLENTAGQGTSVGGEFENLRNIRDLVKNKGNIGYCFDTCHAFAAGYDISTKKGCEETFKKFDDILGIENLKVFHLNDSKGTLGSHLDRHENIGHGKLGKTPFEYIMKNFPDIPKVIETPKEDDWDKINLKLLRSFI
jgi:deoxyribonuclease-4